MPIHRGKANDKFARVNKTPLEDPTLSWKAKGLMAYMLSKPDDWVFYLKELEGHAPDGKDSLRTAVLELERHGYLVREQSRTEEGKFGDSNWQLYAEPDEGETDIEKTDEGKSDIGKVATTKNDSTKTDLTKTDNTARDAEITPVQTHAVEVLPALDDLPSKLHKPSESLYLSYCLELYNRVRLPNWSGCRKLTKRSISHLRELADHFEGYQQAALALEAALAELGRGRNDFYRKNKMSIENLGSNSKFITEAEKSLVQESNRAESTYHSIMGALTDAD